MSQEMVNLFVGIVTKYLGTSQESSVVRHCKRCNTEEEKTKRLFHMQLLIIKVNWTNTCYIQGTN